MVLWVKMNNNEPAKVLPYDIWWGCEVLVRVCADLKPGEKVLIMSDQNSRKIGEAIAQA